MVPLHLEPLAQLLLEQQTESTQFPEVHWFAAVHALPPAFLPTHTPAVQKFPAAQSVSAVQADLHAVAAHT